MKHYYILLLLIISWPGSFISGQDLQQDGAYITFEFEEFDFHQVLQGEKVEVIFNLSNTGNRPLIISNVLTSCGCTASQWPKSPIPPGSLAKLRVRFDSQGKMGKQKKIITVLSNAINNRKEITISAQVLPNPSKIYDDH